MYRDLPDAAPPEGNGTIRSVTEADDGMRRTVPAPGAAWRRVVSGCRSMGRFLRRALLRGVAASIVLPMAIALVVGTGALLASLDDRVGASFCLRLAQVAGVGWLLAVVATAILGAVAALVAGGGPRWRRGGRRRGRHPRRFGPPSGPRRRQGHLRAHHRPQRGPGRGFSDDSTTGERGPG